MNWKEIIIVDAKYLGDYSIEVTFNDGVVRKMDFTDIVNKYPAFARLKNIDIFRQFAITDTLEWLDGAIDIAPEYVYQHGIEQISTPSAADGAAAYNHF